METATGSSQSNIDIPLTAQSGNVGLRLKMAPGQFVYISVQGGKDYGSVVCRITVDGTVISENTASGYGIATCQGTA